MISRRVQANGIRLHYIEEGRGRPVLLLHGFPDFSLSWRHQLPALAAAGYRAVALDLRGYNLSQRLPGIEPYAMTHLVADVVALAATLGEPPVLVGHDWGGVIAWHVAMAHPSLLRGLVILNAPHPRAFARELANPGSLQLLRSWYAGVFQLPRLPEVALRAGGGWLLDRVLRAGPASDPAVLPQYREAFATEDALRAAIAYYRAYTRYPPAAATPVTVPTRVLWGTKDLYLAPSLAEGLDAWVPGVETVVLPDAGHWLQHTHAARVNAEIVAAIGKWT